MTFTETDWPGRSPISGAWPIRMAPLIGSGVTGALPCMRAARGSGGLLGFHGRRVHLLRGACLGNLLALAMDELLNLGRFAGPAAQIVQLRAADAPLAHAYDLGDLGGMNGEYPLHADAIAYLAHGKGLAKAVALHRNHDTLEDLHSFGFSFDDLEVHLHRIADAELLGVFFHLFRLKGLHHVHCRLLLS